MKKIKYDHIIDQSEEIIAIQGIVRGHINLAQYKTAYKYLIKISKKYPASYYIASMLATLNAEDAFCFADNEKNKKFSDAAKKLKVLLSHSKGATERLRKRNINEYYWFAELHKKQYQLGLKEVKAGNIGGLYSQGVGSANYAHKLFLEGKPVRGMRWAQKSQIIWEEFFEKCTKDYHDPWFWYGLSLGLQGLVKEMEAAIKKSAKLSKKNHATDPAFKKLRKMIKMAQQAKSKK